MTTVAGVVEYWAPPALTVVTGASGWLGQALVHRLIDDPRGRVVRLLLREAGPGASFEVTDRVEVIVGDLTDPRTATRLLAGVRRDTDVLHTAGIIHPRRLSDLFDVNVTGTVNLLRAAHAAGVRRVVHVSSNSPFGTNPDPTDVFRADEPYHPYYAYGRSKMHAELAVFAAVAEGLDATIVRPPWFYGPFQPERQTTFFKMVRAGRFPIFGSGQQRRSMVYVDNLVDGVLAAELTPGARGRGYWVADERPYTVTEIVETVGRALVAEGLSVRGGALRLPSVVGRVAELADAFVQRTGRYQQQLHVLGEMDKTIACDVGAARRDLGYEPHIALYEGMRRSIRWCQAQGIEL